MPIIDDVISFTNLLDQFKQLGDDTQNELTFFEISGYPHYENVSSNILAFFLNPGKEHGLNELALSALLESLQVTQNSSNVTVEREVFTGNGRIDLVVYSDEYLIAIENKIFHSLANDLDDYRRFMTDVARGRQVILVVLGLSKVDCSKYPGVISITYSEYFKAIKGNIGKYLYYSNNKFLILLLEFMKSIEHLIDGGIMDNQVLEFFKANRQAAEEFTVVFQNLKTELRKKVNQLGRLVNVNAPDGMVKQWYWRESAILSDDLVHDIKADFPIAVDCWVTPGGWNITIQDRDSGNMDKLKELLNDIGIRYSMDDNGGYRVDCQFVYNEQPEIIAETLLDILNKIIAKKI